MVATHRSATIVVMLRWVKATLYGLDIGLTRKLTRELAGKPENMT